MKKLSLILAAILVVMSFPMMLVSNAFAADGVVVTYTKSGAATTTTSISTALANADTNTTVYLTGGDYVIGARENWGINGKTLTLDLGGNEVYNSYEETARIINFSKTGTSRPTAASQGGVLTIKNGVMRSDSQCSLFQIYSYNHLVFGEGLLVDMHNPGQYGIAIVQVGAKVTYANGCVVKNTIPTPFASEEEIAETNANDSWYPLVGQNEGESVITYEEGSYTETSGPAFKTTKNSTSGTIIVNGGTLVSQYKNLFPTGNSNYSLTINGGKFYNAIMCPIMGNPADGGYTGEAYIINWVGANGTLKITGTPEFYSLYEQDKYFSVGSGVTLADGSIDPSTLTVKLYESEILGTSYLEGAQCRTNLDSLGLRFQSTFDKALIDRINKSAVGEITFGTLIAPYSYVQKTGGEFTKKAFNNNGLNCLNVIAEKGMYLDADGNTVVKAAIVNIKEENKAVDFIATAYVEWTDILGETHISYSNATPEEADARNIVEIANAALEDVRDAAEGEYKNAVVIDSKTVYARINQDQVDALLAIIG